MQDSKWTRRFLVVAGATMMAVLFPSRVAPAVEAGNLPPTAAAAVREAFPRARVIKVGREREHDVLLYDVELVGAEGKRFELEVTADGLLGEIERNTSVKGVPASLLPTVKKIAAHGRITRVEKHEIRGVTMKGRMLSLKKPETMYEIKFKQNGRYRVATLWANGTVSDGDDEDRDKDNDHEQDDD